MTKKTLGDYIKEYKDTELCNGSVIIDFNLGTDSISWLKEHRDFIEASYQKGVIYGHGARCLQYMWKLVVDQMPTEFSFLEIGVYKGQILSLIELCANKANKKPKIVGVTPLFDPDFAKYNRMPYIEGIFRNFSLTMENTTIIDGKSQDEKILELVNNLGPFDIVYIDGDHSYQATVDDIKNYDKCLKSGGFMIVDDASNFKKIPTYASSFKGIIEVSEAVRDTLEKDPSYEDLLTCMHVRIFRKK